MSDGQLFGAYREHLYVALDTKSVSAFRVTAGNQGGIHRRAENGSLSDDGHNLAVLKTLIRCPASIAASVKELI